MTYAEVLDDLIDIFKRHRMINTWGYGNLSDLVTPFRKADIAVTSGNEANSVYNIDYPYAFLQPTNHNLAKGKSTFSFNLIMMEQCEDNQYDIIKAQSNCYQYIQDVLAEIYYNYDQKFDFTLNSTVTPFKEKYDDTVSGMTAAISIEIPMVLDDCLAPFAPKYDNLIVYLGKEGPQVLQPDEGNNFIVMGSGDIFVNDFQGPSAYWNVNRIQVGAEGFKGRVELTYNLQLVDGTGAVLPNPISFAGSQGDEIKGFPTSFDTKARSVTQTWYDVELTTGVLYFYGTVNTPSDEYDMSLTNIEIKMFN